MPVVVYFDQRLGAVHSKCWLKPIFSMFFTFSQDFDAKMINNWHILPYLNSLVNIPENFLYCLIIASKSYKNK